MWSPPSTPFSGAWWIRNNITLPCQRLSILAVTPILSVQLLPCWHHCSLRRWRSLKTGCQSSREEIRLKVRCQWRYYRTISEVGWLLPIKIQKIKTESQNKADNDECIHRYLPCFGFLWTSWALDCNKKTAPSIDDPASTRPSLPKHPLLLRSCLTACILHSNASFRFQTVVWLLR